MTYVCSECGHLITCPDKCVQVIRGKITPDDSFAHGSYAMYHDFCYKSHMEKGDMYEKACNGNVIDAIEHWNHFKETMENDPSS